MQQTETVHHILENEAIELIIFADQQFSADCISIGPGDQYEIWWKEGEKWKDWCITSSPLGYNNPIAKLFKMRLPGAKCFCLCAVYDKDNKTAFQVNMHARIIPANGQKLLSFFANDVKWAYGNNHGQIKIWVKRI